MTIDEVMALDGRELNEAVAVKIGRCPHPFDSLERWAIEDGNDYESGFRCTKCGKEDIYGDQCPDFSRDWSAAMQIRDWARGLGFWKRRAFSDWLRHVIRHRLNDSSVVPCFEPVLLNAEPIDYARAALMVSVEG